MNWHTTVPKPKFLCYDVLHQRLRTMIDTCKLHDDLEDFASYLGVEYDDFYQLIYNLPDEDDDEKVSIGLTD